MGFFRYLWFTRFVLPSLSLSLRSGTDKRRGVGEDWKKFELEDPSWLVILQGGETRNESLKGFEEGRIRWGARG